MPTDMTQINPGYVPRPPRASSGPNLGPAAPNPNAIGFGHSTPTNKYKPQPTRSTAGDVTGEGGGRGGGNIALPTWTPGNVPRPELTPIDPQAAYDPEIQRSLEDQRRHQGNLEQGAGYSMDVLQGRQADNLESQVAQARAAAAQNGIPFDEASFRATAMRGINSAMADEKLGREKMLGAAYGASAETSRGLASDRTGRLQIDLSRDMGENQLGLQRYGQDIQKYGIDTGAAVSANNALMAFYAQLMGAMGNMGSASMSSSNYYG